MPHELDTTNGITSFASLRIPAWHRLGVTLTDSMTAEQALDAAHLSGWNVHKAPLWVHQEPQITLDGVTTPDPILVPEKFATMRTNPVTHELQALGVVGTSYTCIQNEEHTDLLNALRGESNGQFETAGALNGGRSVFVSMKLPETMNLVGHDGKPDTTEMFITAVNSHDGSSAFRIMVTPVRVVCANTLAAAIRSAKSSFSIRHTTNARSNIAAAREALGMTFKFQEAFEVEAQRMIDTEISMAKARDVLTEVFRMKTEDVTERTANSQNDKLSNVLKLWTDADTNANLRGSRYGLYNAVAEYVDHFAPVWSKEATATQRAERVAKGGEVDRLKNDTFALLTVK